MKDPDFTRVYNAFGPEYELIRQKILEAEAEATNGVPLFDGEDVLKRLKEKT